MQVIKRRNGSLKVTFKAQEIFKDSPARKKFIEKYLEKQQRVNPDSLPLSIKGAYPELTTSPSQEIQISLPSPELCYYILHDSNIWERFCSYIRAGLNKGKRLMEMKGKRGKASIPYRNIAVDIIKEYLYSIYKAIKADKDLAKRVEKELRERNKRSDEPVVENDPLHLAAHIVQHYFHKYPSHSWFKQFRIKLLTGRDDRDLRRLIGNSQKDVSRADDSRAAEVLKLFLRD